MTNISVIHLLECKEIECKTELINIESGGNIHIEIKKILLNHDIYASICNQLEKLSGNQNEINTLNNIKIKYELNSIGILDSIHKLKSIGHDVDKLNELFYKGEFEELNEILNLNNFLISFSNIKSILLHRT